MRTTDFCLKVCENKGADQLCSNCTDNQRFCFRYTYGTILLPTSKFQAVAAQAGLCQIRSETPNIDFSRAVTQFILRDFFYRAGRQVVIAAFSNDILIMGQ